MDGTSAATTTITINIDLDDHQIIKQIVESLLYAIEYTRKHSTDVEALVLAHCLEGGPSPSKLTNFLKDTLLPRSTVQYHGDQSHSLQPPHSAVMLLME